MDSAKSFEVCSPEWPTGATGAATGAAGTITTMAMGSRATARRSTMNRCSARTSGEATLAPSAGRVSVSAGAPRIVTLRAAVAAGSSRTSILSMCAASTKSRVRAVQRGSAADSSAAARSRCCRTAWHQGLSVRCSSSPPLPPLNPPSLSDYLPPQDTRRCMRSSHTMSDTT
jgi:hypothetical protein